MVENQIKARRRRRRKPCQFCVESATAIDYKNIEKLSRYITDRGKIVPRRNSGVCARHQRMIATAIKRARYIGLVAYCVD